jgi:hypothetical protein
MPIRPGERFASGSTLEALSPSLYPEKRHIRRQFERAVDLKAPLPVSCSAPVAALEEMVSETWSVDKAYRYARRCCGNNIPLKKLKAFRNRISGKPTAEALDESNEQMCSIPPFELSKFANLSGTLTNKWST